MLEEHLLGLPQARPELSALLSKAQDLLGTDEFELFPPSTRPQDLCAIIGGVGARSFLHSDPMEWMGWNVLLEGRKVWTFLPPLPDLDASLETYRLAPNAFGSHNISAGWQSNVDLYQQGSTSAVDGSTCASWPVEGEGHEVMQHAISGVQETGDLVLIPPRHWHQVWLGPFFFYRTTGGRYAAANLVADTPPPTNKNKQQSYFVSLGPVEQA